MGLPLIFSKFLVTLMWAPETPVWIHFYLLLQEVSEVLRHYPMLQYLVRTWYVFWTWSQFRPECGFIWSIPWTQVCFKPSLSQTERKPLYSGQNIFCIRVQWNAEVHSKTLLLLYVVCLLFGTDEYLRHHNDKIPLSVVQIYSIHL